jgi:hypothetical protein
VNASFCQIEQAGMITDEETSKDVMAMISLEVS